MTLAKLLLLHGPNLNLLGEREPEHYGAETLATINARLRAEAQRAGHDLDVRQSNAEHELVEAVQQAAREGVAFLIINPAAFTHTSVALRDAVLGARLPFIEVHLSNVHAREPFRRQSFFSDLAEGVITGLGARGYDYALTDAIRRLESKEHGRPVPVAGAEARA